MKLHFIHCNKCKADYLVGIDNKNIVQSKTSGGKLGKTPYMAIGNDEIEKAPRLEDNDEINCSKCGTCCKVETKCPI